MPNLSAQLLSTLKELKIIDTKELDSAYTQSVKDNQSFIDMLLRKNLISDENLGKLISEILQLPYIRLEKIPISSSVLEIVPEKVARAQKIIVFRKDVNQISLAINNPENTLIVDFLAKKTGCKIIKFYATLQDIKQALLLYTKSMSKVFDEIINLESSKSKQKFFKNDDLPVIHIVDTILEYAVQNKASDVHLEALDNTSLIRFRIDGVLHDMATLPFQIHDRIISRIKVLSKLRTDEHQAAQDGKFQYGSEKTDIRVSVIPIVTGEKIVMRLLSEKSREFSLSDLGSKQNDLEKIKNAFHKPYGMILSTGPTGCGKTTTMYAVLKMLNNRKINIMTIEDPVEYAISGVNQIQVNPKTNLTFAQGLRSILRQDPNVILVGEIRDKETAGIAVNSAMTGHLVLSTLHTNDSSTAIPRLFDMNIEPFLIASSVNIIIGQRLIRKICQSCRVSVERKISDFKNQLTPQTLKKIFGNKKLITLYQGKGCPVCHNTGYLGRTGIFEILEVTEEIKKAIVQKNDASIIKNIAISQNMSTMLDDGIAKAMEGSTTIEEVMRAATE